MRFLAEKLNIKEDVELSVAYNDSLLNRLSNENVEYSALLQNPVPKQYFLFVKSDINELQYILCHEMVHLSQYERGDLKISSDYKTIT